MFIISYNTFWHHRPRWLCQLDIHHLNGKHQAVFSNRDKNGKRQIWITTIIDDTFSSLLASESEKTQSKPSSEELDVELVELDVELVVSCFFKVATTVLFFAVVFFPSLPLKASEPLPFLSIPENFFIAVPEPPSFPPFSNPAFFPPFPLGSLPLAFVRSPSAALLAGTFSVEPVFLLAITGMLEPFPTISLLTRLRLETAVLRVSLDIVTGSSNGSSTAQRSSCYLLKTTDKGFLQDSRSLFWVGLRNGGHHSKYLLILKKKHS